MWGPPHTLFLFYLVLICLNCAVVGAQDSSLKLWDLRKLKNFKTITLDNNYEVCQCSVVIGSVDLLVYCDLYSPNHKEIEMIN